MIEAASRSPIDHMNPLYIKYLEQIHRLVESPKANLINADLLWDMYSWA